MKITEEQKRVENEHLETRVVLGKYKGVAEITPKNTNNFERDPEYTLESDKELVKDNFNAKSDELLIECGIVSFLPTEYDRVWEVSENDEDFVQEEAVDEKPVCYYVIGNGVIEE